MEQDIQELLAIKEELETQLSRKNEELAQQSQDGIEAKYQKANQNKELQVLQKR